MAEVLIVGGGRIGAYLAALLAGAGDAVCLVEVAPHRVDHLRRTLGGITVVHGSGTDPTVLESAGARRAPTVVAVTARDETNLVVTSLARFEFAAPRTIAKVNNPANAWLYTTEMGVDVALNQADIIGHLVAEEMSLGEMTTLLKLRRGQYALVEEQVHVTSVAAGCRVASLGLPAACVLVGVVRGSDLLLPHGDTVLQPGDEVLAVVATHTAATLAALLGPSR
jgi:trk system potassium uptake protein